MDNQLDEYYLLVVNQVFQGKESLFLYVMDLKGLHDFAYCAEEILLENVELILEAFDYLQLPFALKSGIALFIGYLC